MPSKRDSEAEARLERVMPIDRNRLIAADAVSTQGIGTDRRRRRIASVLARRQLGLTVVLEDVHDVHNASAVLRSCDAVGVLDVHLVYVQQEMPRESFGRATSASAAKWMRLHTHTSIEACYDVLRSQGFSIWATALNDESRQLYDLDLAVPTAFVFGNEQTGVSVAAADLADGTVFIPMHGMVESLNISVACAVTLYEAMRQRMVAGAYDRPTLASETRASLEADWIRR